MERSEKRTLLRIMGGAALYVAAIIMPELPFMPEELVKYWEVIMYLPAYLVIGGDVLLRALKNIMRGQVFDENFLMCIATIGAFFVGESIEAVAVMLFYQVGEMFQTHAVGKSRKSIAELMNIRADYANIEQNGTLLKVDPEEVKVGDIIVIKPGERVPLDGVVIDGVSTLDTSALTGEAEPRGATIGSEVLSGCVNMEGLLRLQVTAVFEESTVARILDLVENASSKKAKAERFITKFARYYTPSVVFAAVFLAFLPPLFFAGQWSIWVHRALTFLVVSCPCALVISVPLSFFGGIGGASSHGILIKGSNYLEALARVDTIVFDKTGTLTEGKFMLTEILPGNESIISRDELLELAAYGEIYSNHPIAMSIKDANSSVLDGGRVTDYEVISGKGTRLRLDGKQILLGNATLMKENGISFDKPEESGTNVFIAADGNFLGTLVISDRIKDDSADAIKMLKSVGVLKTVMLTGDREQVANAVGKQLAINEIHAQLLPADKVSVVEMLLVQQTKGAKLAFVGDGINDAPVLSRADVGIAMGGLGSDAAIEAADIVLMDDKPSKIAEAIKIARKTVKIVRQNVVLALGVKGVVLVLSALGFANMWAAVFADVGVSVLAIINAMRALKA